MIILLACVLAVPTVGELLGVYDGQPTQEQLRAALAVGTLLGVAHLVLRPVLRVLFAPLGCLTFGLFGLVIDLALLYGSGRLVPDFVMPGPVYAVVTALLINAVCAIAGVRK